jgi:alpha-N-acetylgalactosaminidase
MSVTYPKLGKYLNATGRQILFTCSWPVYTSLSAECGGSFANESCFPADLIVPACSTWRVFKDIMDAYNLPGHAGVRQIIDFYAQNNVSLRAASGPGHYNDYDMLLAGDAGLSVDEAKIQMGMWAMWSAPLLMSNDLRNIDPAFVEVCRHNCAVPPPRTRTHSRTHTRTHTRKQAHTLTLTHSHAHAHTLAHTGPSQRGSDCR